MTNDGKCWNAEKPSENFSLCISVLRRRNAIFQEMKCVFSCFIVVFGIFVVTLHLKVWNAHRLAADVRYHSSARCCVRCHSESGDGYLVLGVDGYFWGQKSLPMQGDLEGLQLRSSFALNPFQIPFQNGRMKDEKGKPNIKRKATR